MARKITKQYQDPLDIIWLHVARQCGIRVQRDTDVFASWDGKGLLRIGTSESLDADDSLAQMILHELCHAQVAGPNAFSKEDWGLDYDDVDHQVFERAALRLQAALADQVGLRLFFASTTDYREYFDHIPEDALESSDDPAKDDPALELAREAMHRLATSSWNEPIRNGLELTKRIAELMSEIASCDSIWLADRPVEDLTPSNSADSNC